MQKYVILNLPDKADWDYISFIVRLIVFDQRYTGYKEVEDAGIDLDHFLKETGLKLYSNGSIKVTQLFKDKYRRLLNSPDRPRYYLDTDIFFFETDISGAFECKDPAWFIPDAEFNAYDASMFNELPEQLQHWFLRKIKKGCTTKAQVLLENTYKKYVIDGKPLLGFPDCDSPKESSS